MFSLRAPLFPVGLAFAMGCLAGLEGWFSLRVALTAFAGAGLLWFCLRGHEKTSLVTFYLFVACAGLTHTLLVSSAIAPDDPRQLPEEKILPTTQWRGVIVEEPVERAAMRTNRRTLDRTSFVLNLEAWRPTDGRLFGAEIDARWQSAQGRIRCAVLGPAQDLRFGDRIEFAAPLKPVPVPLSPGEFDAPAWEADQGIYYRAMIAAVDWRRTGAGEGSWWRNFSYRARDWAYGRLQLGLEDDPRMADFLAGMLIGYRQQIPADIEQDFRRTGTLHVFAVSGQNIAEVLVVVMIMLQLCGLVRWRWAWVLAPVVIVYCLLTGSPASAVRATVMALTVLLAWRLGRPLNALACWSLAFLAMLIWNPPLLLNPGAQLSFGVVLGIILIAPPLVRLLSRVFAPDPFLLRSLLTTAQRAEEKGWHWFSVLLSATVAATLVSEPITAVDFHQVTTVSVLANLIVVPMAGFITAIGTLSVTVSLVSGTLAALLNNANWLLAKILIVFVGFLAREPGAAINVPDIRALTSPSPAFIVAPLQDSACLLVRSGNGAWLVNVGRETVTRPVTERLLQSYGINRLDGLFFAQMSTPDNGGGVLLVQDLPIRRLIVPALSTRSPLEKQIPEIERLARLKSTRWARGQSLELASGVRLEALGPAIESVETRAEDRALVLLFHAGSQTLLWAGRLGPSAQEELLAAYPSLHADVLVMGCTPPPSREWLQALQVRQWLQIPPRDPQLNDRIYPENVRDICEVWPLEETGAVDIHFKDAEGGEPAKIRMQPWVRLPAKN